ncbi:MULTISPECIES: exopolysaccharide biosynthesis polyprenyl glycosylphosphotransferase [unclassified Butyrivibrio]|uniref:exopolysaccharide biosynthesis polyprenyl glycosylphosphotransferase n=1 Tax=unclassified Butyrivibrio TaxID=2639466 RepID=UPI0003B6497F|nr:MULTISPECIES: exopolysaccharide biosynthesis polyprenyl glycosylphosphotransferase [unclassified Butyrivibrio]SDB37640.1 exopolysaccharide biosynthesis polyprenyl glycosylphosphotransferase [Butyrivibrio sp. INlla16]SEK82347.1 exopolysaccharide biosynthesis polyprenyl glycosylphosphotransferase [Butyrivibrio sp. ob235]
MKQIESIKRVFVLCLGLIGLLMQTVVYGYFWIKTYYPLVSAPRISADGYQLGAGLKLYFRGHVLVIAIYFVLMLFFSNTYGGLKIGYLKSMDIFLSQIFALFMVNVISYFQISLMRNWLVPAFPMLEILIVQMVISFLWAVCTNWLYRAIFPARQMLLVSGEYPVDDILRKFNSRQDKYNIVKCMNISEGLMNIERECLERYDAVVIWDIPTKDRNKLLKFLYSNSIRVYMMPKITDVLVKGSTQMHLFDTPVLLLREYYLKVEQRAIKRLVDIICSLILIILTSPIMLITAIVIKLYDHGPVLYKQIRCTINQKEFKIMKFRSMRVDAEKDGVARLATKNDSRITPIGKFIRACRIDELPQLFNILKGEMSFIGPRPERPEIIEQYMETMPEFAFRMKVKAGLAGYAQVYGKYNTTPYDKLKLDLAYIENYSVWLDFKLMLLTLKILFTPDATEGVEETQTTALKKPE